MKGIIYFKNTFNIHYALPFFLKKNHKKEKD